MALLSRAMIRGHPGMLSSPTHCISVPRLRKLYSSQQLALHAKMLGKGISKYKFNGKLVATNRHKRMSQDDDTDKKKAKAQTTDSLEEWRNEQYLSFFTDAIEAGSDPISAHLAAVLEARRKVSKLTAFKSIRAYAPKERAFYPGDVVLYHGKRRVISGQKNNGQYQLFEGYGEKYFKSCDCKLIEKNRGLVYL